MTPFQIIILIIMVIGFAGLFYLLNKKLNKTDDQEKKEDDKSFVMLQNQIAEISKTLDSKLGESTKMLQNQFGHSTKMLQAQFGQSAKIIQEVTERLTKLDDTNKQVMGFAQQLQSLENILKNPKQRGVLGEYFLQTVLENVLPPTAFQMQYKFANGESVDAVVFTKEGIVPIDSKFSLENYNKIAESKDSVQKQNLEKLFKQDLKKRIDETSKYIRPKENTTDFAFMFIPSEAIYYDLLVNQVGSIKVNTRDLIEYAFKEKKVIIVSPTTFFAYLQTVLHGLHALRIEESAKDIRSRVEKLRRHLAAYESYMKKVGGSLSTTVNHYNSATKEYGKIDKDVVKITGGQTAYQAETLDRPNLEG